MKQALQPVKSWLALVKTLENNDYLCLVKRHLRVIHHGADLYHLALLMPIRIALKLPAAPSSETE